MKRLALFLRSVIPADPWQLVFLLGAVFLLVLPRLPLRPDSLIISTTQLWPRNGPLDISELSIYLSLYATVLFVTGLIALFTCFWPGRRPVRRILWGVLIPPALLFVVIVRSYFLLTQPPTSLFYPHNTLGQIFAWFRVNVWEFPAGSYFSALALILIATFVLRLASGASTLPLSLASQPVSPEGGSGSWPQVVGLIFVLVGLLAFLNRLFQIPLFVISSRLFGQRDSAAFSHVLDGISDLAGAALLVGVSLYFLGRDGKRDAMRSLRLPQPRFALFALILPVAIHVLPPIAYYLVDRVDWAAHQFGQMSAPQLVTYFDFSRAWDPWLLLLIFSALAEEIVFRGILLPRLMDRFGFHHGIFLIGLVWAAVHFQPDSYSGFSVGGVFYHLAFRIIDGLAMNYVLAWLTLRCKSIIPATIAHAVSNMLIFGGISDRIPYRSELRLITWAIVAFLLFRYWPVAQIEPPKTEPAISPLEPAV